MWVPRLGRMRGSSASSCSSSRAQLVGPHAGRVDDVRGAHVEALAALDVERAHAVRASVALEQSGDVDAVGADRAEALGLAEHRQHEPHVVGLAVVEQVAAGRLARGERRQQLEHLLAGDHAVALGAPGLGCRRGSPAAPRSARALGTLRAARAFDRRERRRRGRPTSRRRGSARRPTRRSGRAPSNAGTTSGSGRTRCGASATISWRSSSASRTRPRSKFCR